MSTLTIKRDSNLKDIEEILQHIVEAESEIVLRVPNSLKYIGALGIEAQVIQLISTWLRRYEGITTFHTFIKDDYSEESFDGLCSRMFGIQALSLADNVVTASGKKIRRRTSLEAAAKRVSDLRNFNFNSAFKGPYLGIPLVRAPGNENELISPFYNGDAVVDRYRFKKITENAIKTVLQKNSYEKSINDDVLGNITSIVYELFTNTDKHARRDEHGNILSKNFRCVIFSSTSLSEGQLDGWVRSGSGLLFAANWKEKIKEKTLRLLEISIVDSGPGFACRWKGVAKDELTINDQMDAVVSCFKKYETTDLASSAGSGLTNVMIDLRKLKGWFRLRTGNFAVEKSFLDESRSVEVAKNDLKKMKAFAEGAAITFVIPLSTRLD